MYGVAATSAWGRQAPVGYVGKPTGGHLDDPQRVVAGLILPLRGCVHAPAHHVTRPQPRIGGIAAGA